MMRSKDKKIRDYWQEKDLTDPKVISDLINKLVEADSLVYSGYELVQKSNVVITRLIELINEHHQSVQLPTEVDTKLYLGTAAILSVVGWAKD